jgi:hypothetical protein
MAYLQTNVQLGLILEGLAMEDVGIFYGKLSILRPFETCILHSYVHFVYIVVIRCMVQGLFTRSVIFVLLCRATHS